MNTVVSILKYEPSNGNTDFLGGETVVCARLRRWTMFSRAVIKCARQTHNIYNTWWRASRIAAAVRLAILKQLSRSELRRRCMLAASEEIFAHFHKRFSSLPTFGSRTVTVRSG